VRSDDLELVIYFLRKVYPGVGEVDLLVGLLDRLEHEKQQRKQRKQKQHG